jgi:hypothetical protein
LCPAAGLVRFASEQYSSSKSSLKHATMHLTNYSINKKAPNFKQPSSSDRADSTCTSSCQKQQRQDVQGAGASDACAAAGDGDEADDCESDGCRNTPDAAAAASKWSFGQLAEHLQQQGHSWQSVWDQVGAVNKCVQ